MLARQDRSPGYVVYNPALLDDEDLVHIFVARDSLIARVTTDLREAGRRGEPPHLLLVGPRGMGKTTFLRRLDVAIRSDPTLSNDWLPLSFPEEQYNIRKVSDLWLNCLDAVADALERAGARQEAAALDQERDDLPSGGDGQIAERALDLLLRSTRPRRLVLLIDNLNLVLDRLGEQRPRLLEALRRGGAPVLIAASPCLPDAMGESDGWARALPVTTLAPLDRDEAWQCLDRLCRLQNTPQVMNTLKADPARFKTLHTLTGGSPRTLVLLYGVLASSDEDQVARDVERLLDQCTPYYKARFEELSDSLQVVVDALALRWDPTGAGDLADTMGMEVNQVSAGLNRLVTLGVVERVQLPHTHHHGFQLAERFFNIWYLMRSSRRVKRKLSWLVEYLKIFYGAQGLPDRVERMLSRARHIETATRLDPDLVLAFADITPLPAQRSALLRVRADMLMAGGSGAARAPQLPGDADPDLAQVIEQKGAIRRMRDEVMALTLTLPDELTREILWLLMVASLQSLPQKQAMTSALPRLSSEELEALALVLDAHTLALKQIHGDASTAALFHSLQAGDIENHWDVAGAEAYEARTGKRGLVRVAWLYAWLSNPTTQDAAELLRLLESEGTPLERLFWAAEAACLPDWQARAQKVVNGAWSEVPDGMEHLAARTHLMYLAGRGLLLPPSAAAALHRGAKHHPGDPTVLLLHAEMMLADPARRAEAMATLEQVLALASSFVSPWSPGMPSIPLLSAVAQIPARLCHILQVAARLDLAVLYLSEATSNSRYQEHLRAILEIAPDHSLAHLLMGMLDDDDKSRAGHLQHVGEAPLDSFWLGWLYHWLPGFHERLESALRALTDLKGASAAAPHALHLLLTHQGRWAEAEAPLREALRRDPSQRPWQLRLAWLLIWHLDRPNDAVPILREILRHQPTAPEAAVLLARALEVTGRAPQAAKMLREAGIEHPNNKEIWKTLALLDGLSKRREMSAWERVVAIDPDDADAHHMLGLHRLVCASIKNRGPLLDAEAHLRRSLELRQDDEVLCTLLTVLSASGDVTALLAEISGILTRPLPLEAQIAAEVQESLVDLCKLGHADAARAQLKHEGWDERWRPLALAMDAFIARDSSLLLGVAPEFRAPAEEILADLWPESERAPKPPRGRGVRAKTSKAEK